MTANLAATGSGDQTPNPPTDNLSEKRRSAQWVTDEVKGIVERRGGTELCKGMLMLIYRLDADQAFELLRWRSQETNVNLRVLAERILEDFRALDYDDIIPPRSTFDRILMTAHLRISHDDIAS